MDSKPIKSLLSDSEVYKINIPIFQRPYRWEKTQINQFLSDFDIVHTRSKSDSEGMTNYHFLGLIVYVEKENEDFSIDVIDGQQRLTTIFIFLSVVRDMLQSLRDNDMLKLPQDDQEELIATIREISKILQDPANSLKKPRLVTENESFLESDFLEIIQKTKSALLDELPNFKTEFENQSESYKNICDAKSSAMKNYADGRRTAAKKSFKCYNLIYEHLDEKVETYKDPRDRFNELHSFYTIINERFHAISFKLENYSKAFEYFEVLNDRGLEVSALDLIKNFCLRKAEDKDERHNLFKIWKNIFSETLNENYDLILFIRYAYMAQNGHITKKEIYSSYSDLLGEKELTDLENFLSSTLHSQAKVFRVLTNNDSVILQRDSVAFHNVIEILRSTKTKQWYSVALAVLTPIVEYSYNLSDANELPEILKLFENLHELMFVFNYSEKLANKLETKFPLIAEKVFNDNDKEAYLESIKTVTEDLIKAKGTEKLSFDDVDLGTLENPDFFESNNDYGNMLLSLLNYKSEQTNTNKMTIQSLEHVVPQSVPENKWSDFFKMKRGEQRKNIYSIGNFLNTSESNNSTFGTLSFKDKKKKYAGKVFDPITDQGLNYKSIPDDGWNAKLIEKRKDKLIEMFKEFCLKQKKS